jgi:hypothetical protein
MHVAVVTMVYNEGVNLPIWVRHYKAHCPGATLFVIDHGSDDGSTHGLPEVNLIPFPRTPFDDQTRAEIVTDFQHALLRLYDVVIYTDCDEMLVADPRIHASLGSFLASVESDAIASRGSRRACASHLSRGFRLFGSPVFMRATGSRTTAPTCISSI